MKRFLESQGTEDMLLAEINVRFFDLYKQFRYSQKIRTDTVNKELSTFQLMFQMSMEYGYLQHNAVKNVKRDKSQIPPERFRTHVEILKLLESGHYNAAEIKDIKRYRYLTPDEIARLLSLAEGKWLHPVLVTFSHTGMRRREIVKLEHADLDMERRYLWIRSKKQSLSLRETQRRIYINDELLAVLRKQKERTRDHRWFFTGPDGNRLKESSLREALRSLVKGTEFEGVGYHTFRHSLASNLAARGVDQRIIDDILGHQTDMMRKRYRHLFPQQEPALEFSYLKSEPE